MILHKMFLFKLEFIWMSKVIFIISTSLIPNSLDFLD